MDDTDTERLKAAGAEAGGGAGAGGGGLWRAVLAELLATALLVLCSCLPAAFDASPTHSALAAGAVVAMLVQCFDDISGAMMNPAVTLAAALARRVGWRRGAWYGAAQLAGAALGALAAPRCVTRPAAALGAGGAAALEALLSALLALANCAHWDPRGASLADSWPLRIGAVVTALSLIAGPLTGASMNPARSFGPALCAADWTDHWVYWLGPLGGAAGGALLHRALWRHRPPPPPRRPPPPPRRPPAAAAAAAAV